MKQPNKNPNRTRKLTVGWLVLTVLALQFLSCMQDTKPLNQNNSIQKLNLMPQAPAWGALWQQRAAEYRALSFQAYNAARFGLWEALRHGHNKPLAIVTDIDETVLDNSPYYVHQAIEGQIYSDSSWVAWTRHVACDSVPGAPSFFRYAASRGVSIFYITNRIRQDRTQTIANLKKLKFPNCDNAHLLLMDSTSSKTDRRKKVSDQYEILMLIGDNLGDFSGVFNNYNRDNRLNWAENNKQLFGTKFIVLPNNMYGNWEESYYQGKQPKSTADSNSVLNGLMRSY